MYSDEEIVNMPKDTLLKLILETNSLLGSRIKLKACGRNTHHILEISQIVKDIPCQIMHQPPENWDPNKEFYIALLTTTNPNVRWGPIMKHTLE